MRRHQYKTFRQVDRKTLFLLPPSMDEWLPEGHSARFVIEIVAVTIQAGDHPLGNMTIFPQTEPAEKPVGMLDFQSAQS